MLRRIAGAVTGWDRLDWEQKKALRHRASCIIALLLAPLPIPLWRLLQWAGSDKERPGQHAYGRTYGELFRPMKYRRTTFLEIGIFNGRSMLAWQAFFPFGRIVGCDIEPKEDLAGPRRRIFRTDQSSASDLRVVVQQEGPFDIILDDGSHRNAHQLFTFHELFPSLRSNGVYIVEDVQTSFWPGKVGRSSWDGAMVGSPEFAQTCVGYFCELSKYLNHAEFVAGQDIDQRKLELAKQIRSIRFEHNLIIVTKGRNDAPSNVAGALQA